MQCLLVAAAALALGTSAGALELPAVYGPSMVFQHSVPAVVWGWGTPASNVTVALTQTATPATVTTVVNATGQWSVSLPEQNPSTNPGTITITSGKEILSLPDIVFGNVFLCSGQSNMELAVQNSLNASEELARAGTHGAGFRIFQVAMLQDYCNVTEPQTNLTTSIPWGRPVAPGTDLTESPLGAVGVNPAGMSAMCYYYGVELATAHPEIPVGMMASSWGGTAIEVWMTPTALAACGEGENLKDTVNHWTFENNPDPGLGYLSLETHSALGSCTVPNVPSTLWNSMIAPLLPFKMSGFLWYQGESNSGAPERYAKCFPEKIRRWRSDFQLAEDTPYLFAQIAPWPNHNVGLISGIRYAQTAALDLAGVGMVVTADIGDPAGVYHPIHPPYKSEVGRRAALIAENLVFGNRSVSLTGPQITHVSWDEWEPSWGSFHHGTPGPGTSPVCAPGNPNGWVCGGLQVTFDRDIEYRASYGVVYGMSSGFELFNNVTGQAETGGTSAGDRQLTSTLCLDCTKCPCSQPLSVTGMVGSRTLQLNTTYISGHPSILKYAFADYPTMLIFDADGRPAAPFNVTIPYSAKP